MVSNYNIFSKKLDEQVNAIYKAHKNEIIIYQNCKGEILNVFKMLENYADKHNFQNEDEEIRYFKKIKPSIFALLLLYDEMQKVLIKIKPFGESPLYQDKIIKELETIESFYSSNLEFINYYQSGQKHFDHSFFLAKNLEINNLPSYISIHPNTRILCNKGYLIAELLAHNHLANFLNLKLKNPLAIYHPLEEKEYEIPELTWTASKADLTELIYGLKYSNAINEGQAEIKEITKAFEGLFNIKIKSPYNTFKEIKFRKKESSSFLKTIYNTINKMSQS